MTFVVTEACIRCKYTDCVDVCPVDAFRAGKLMLVIDPDECIDCAVCIPECPLEAIFAEDDLPADQGDYVGLNAELARRWPKLTKKVPALPEAEHWRTVRAKRALLDAGIDAEIDAEIDAKTGAESGADDQTAHHAA